jgi:hypothetical protein
MVVQVKSEKYFFKVKEIIVVTAYLRQMHLSMDRINRASYLELADYYQQNVMPNQVLEYVNRSKSVAIPKTIQPLLDNTIRVRGEALMSLATITTNQTGRYKIRVHLEGVKSLFWASKNWILRTVQGGYYLSEEEMQCILFFLDAFSKVLQNAHAPTPPHDLLHSKIERFSDACLEPKLGNKWSKVMQVEHFMQTPWLKCLSIATIVGDENWYK